MTVFLDNYLQGTGKSRATNEESRDYGWGILLYRNRDGIKNRSLNWE